MVASKANTTKIICIAFWIDINLNNSWKIIFYNLIFNYLTFFKHLSFIDTISLYSQFSILGSVGSPYQSYGVTTNGTLRVYKSMCYFNQVKFPTTITTILNGITAFEKTTSTLLHCGGNLVRVFPCELWLLPLLFFFQKICSRQD